MFLSSTASALTLSSFKEHCRAGMSKGEQYSSMSLGICSGYILGIQGLDKVVATQAKSNPMICMKTSPEITIRFVLEFIDSTYANELDNTSAAFAVAPALMSLCPSE